MLAALLLGLVVPASSFVPVVLPAARPGGAFGRADEAPLRLRAPSAAPRLRPLRVTKFADGESDLATSVKKNVGTLVSDMGILDQSVRAELSGSELFLLATAVIGSSSAPFLVPLTVTKLLVPGLSALCALIGVSSEFYGKVAVCTGKEVAAATLQASAEAEALLARAERAKAVLPLCVGIATTASAFALIAPALITTAHIQFATEALLVPPLFATLAAAVAGLATEEARDFASESVGLGARRFATSEQVGATWMSTTEQINARARSSTTRWQSYAANTLPAPVIASLFIPGGLEFKAVVGAAIATCQAAWCLAAAESYIARATEAVALKSRAAAISDTYANQGARAGAVLPFTSALAGLAAASCAAAVEALPLLPNPLAQSVGCFAFPAVGAVFAGAAALSRARCEVDAAAATEAALDMVITEAVDEMREKMGKDGWSKRLPVALQDVIALGRSSLAFLRRRLAERFRRRPRPA